MALLAQAWSAWREAAGAGLDPRAVAVATVMEATLTAMLDTHDAVPNETDTEESIALRAKIGWNALRGLQSEANAYVMADGMILPPLDTSDIVNELLDFAEHGIRDGTPPVEIIGNVAVLARSRLGVADDPPNETLEQRVTRVVGAVLDGDDFGQAMLLVFNEGVLNEIDGADDEAKRWAEKWAKAHPGDRVDPADIATTMRARIIVRGVLVAHGIDAGVVKQALESSAPGRVMRGKSKGKRAPSMAR